MKISVITIFPEMFDVLKYGVVGQAIRDKICEINVVNLRDFTDDVHRTVDDRPFGGGPGMVMLVEPIYKALCSVDPDHTGFRILLSCSGQVFDQKKAFKLSKIGNIIFVCGRYEGVDERVVNFVDEEISIGDYVISGGELATCVIIDSVIRLLPKTVGNPDSIIEESFSSGLLEYPQYTRPRSFMGYDVPNILFSGNHERIRRWRRYQSIIRTRERRPDLFEKFCLTDEDKIIISQLEAAYENSKDNNESD
ncbi:MAG: tRNA (guanosine(37)-N1)-methyltransferase TrmD [Deltaproteobacteria bacterium]|nr:tRNA (guanosine(37)-N1)-methyltransferase TrmD [Deltaproteobacteria bacterium]